MVGYSRLPGSWQNVLHLDKNRTDLFDFLATHIEMKQQIELLLQKEKML